MALAAVKAKSDSGEAIAENFAANLEGDTATTSGLRAPEEGQVDPLPRLSAFEK